MFESTADISSVLCLLCRLWGFVGVVMEGYGGLWRAWDYVCYICIMLALTNTHVVDFLGQSGLDWIVHC